MGLAHGDEAWDIFHSTMTCLDRFQRELRKALQGRPVATVALAAGLPKDAVRSVLLGHDPSLTRASKLAEALDLKFSIGTHCDLESSVDGVLDPAPLAETNASTSQVWVQETFAMLRDELLEELPERIATLLREPREAPQNSATSEQPNDQAFGQAHEHSATGNAQQDGGGGTQEGTPGSTVPLVVEFPAKEYPEQPLSAIDWSLYVEGPFFRDLAGAASSGTEVWGRAAGLRIAILRSALWYPPDGRMSFGLVSGDSMGPTLRHGDLIAIDHSRRTLTHGQIFAILTAERLIFRRLEQRDDRWEYTSDNDRCQARRLRANDHIVGRVVWSGPGPRDEGRDR